MTPRVRLSATRRTAGWLIGLAGGPALALLLVPVRDEVTLSSVLLLFLLLVVLAAATGGALPAFAASVIGFLLANYLFTPPLHHWSIAKPADLVALLVFVAVGGIVSGFLATVTRRSAEAEHARAEARMLAQVAATSASDDPLPTLVQQVREAFGLDAASVLRRYDGHAWQVEASAGAPAPTTPESATTSLALGDSGVLALFGHELTAEDRDVLTAFTAQLSAALERRRLNAEAGRAAVLAEANALRTALLAAVSHDLRTPLAGIKASVTSLLQDDVEWPPEAVRDFCGAIDAETDRLTRLVENLLDMSRLQAGALTLARRPVGLDEIVPAAIASLGQRRGSDRIEIAVPETLPRVAADPALLERALANLVDNALAWSPPGEAVRIEASGDGPLVQLRVADRGPGIPAVERDRVFLPFQRLGDRSNGAGVGLGLAVARGFVQALGGDLRIEDRPGGGLVMLVELRAGSER